jgi:hypothetical protein
VSTRYVTLVASTVSTVSVASGDPYTDVIADAPDRVLIPEMEVLEVVNVDGGGIVYFTYGFEDGFESAASAGAIPSAPTIAGPNTLMVPAVRGASVQVNPPPEHNVAVVRAISAGTPQIGVSTVAVERQGEEEGGGGGLVSHGQTLVSADVSASSATWATMTNYEVTIAAAAGDVVDLHLSTYPNAFTANAQLAMDIGTVVSGSVVNRVSGGTGNSDLGCLEAFTVQGSGAALLGRGPCRRYVVQAGDVSGGNVTFRGLYRMVVASCTLSASANIRSLIQATNLGAP